MNDPALEATYLDHLRALWRQRWPKGVPDAPQCGFSAICVQILDHLGTEFVGVNVLQSDDLRQGIKTFTDWPTIPQLYVNGEFVGGSDIIRQMFEAGELKPFLVEQGVLPG